MPQLIVSKTPKAGSVQLTMRDPDILEIIFVLVVGVDGDISRVIRVALIVTVVLSNSC